VSTQVRPGVLARVRGALHARAGLLPLGVAALFVARASTEVGTVMGNFDEGVYVLQAQRVVAGDVPYADFFYHQTPLYLYALAAFSAWSPGSLVAARVLSLLATTASGLIVGRLARSTVSPGVALVAQLAFYSAPLQRFGLLALPNALMLLASLCGVLAITRSDRPRGAVIAGACLAVAVLVKPLDVPVVLAVGLALLLDPLARLRKLPWLVLSGAATALLAFLVSQALSGGGFGAMLALQAGRYSGRSGFDVMSNFADFHAAMVRRGVRDAVGWNWSEHVAAFTDYGPINGNLWLLLAGLGGLYVGRKRLPANLRWLFGLWLGLPLCFSLFVWEPSWDHYFIQYVPVLSIGAALAFREAIERTSRTRRVAVGLVVAHSLLGLVSRPPDARFHARASEIARSQRGPFFTFNPLIHAAAGTTQACGMIDPMNVYGEHCAAALAPEGALARFRVSTDALLRCLRRDVPVVVDRYAFWFMDERTWRRLATTPDRLTFFEPDDRKRFERGPLAKEPAR
jgi:hypothetical protein